MEAMLKRDGSILKATRSYRKMGMASDYSCILKRSLYLLGGGRGLGGDKKLKQKDQFD